MWCVLHTDFLFVQNILKDSDSANAETLFTLLTNKMTELKMEINKVSSLVSDGASVTVCYVPEQILQPDLKKSIPQ